ncbi:hypothetical protein BDV97DRAFT_88563 [Delphinella strobiligena]|nr:hypothetical protein BDV97DRAFT_88563 [Delphinella strobiligena]
MQQTLSILPGLEGHLVHCKSFLPDHSLHNLVPFRQCGSAWVNASTIVDAHPSRYIQIFPRNPSRDTICHPPLSFPCSPSLASCLKAYCSLKRKAIMLSTKIDPDTIVGIVFGVIGAAGAVPGVAMIVQHISNRRSRSQNTLSIRKSTLLPIQKPNCAIFLHRLYWGPRDWSIVCPCLQSRRWSYGTSSAPPIRAQSSPSQY